MTGNKPTLKKTAKNTEMNNTSSSTKPFANITESSHHRKVPGQREHINPSSIGEWLQDFVIDIISRVQSWTEKIRTTFKQWRETFKQWRKIPYLLPITLILVILALLPMVWNLILSTHSNYLFHQAERAIADSQYETAIDYLLSARQKSDNPEITFALAQAYTYTGASNKALIELIQLEKEPVIRTQPSYWYYQALLRYQQINPQKALEHVQQSIALSDTYLPAWYLMAHINFFLYNDATVAIENLDKLRQATEMLDSTTVNHFVNDIRRINQLSSGTFSALNISGRAPLPFEFDQIENLISVGNQFQLPLPLDGFHNFYFIPTNLLVTASSSFADNITFWQTIIAIHQHNIKQATIYLSQFKEQDSPHYAALAGYLSIKRRSDYATALASYRQLLDYEPADGDALLLFANAAWVASGGQIPSDEILTAYQQVLDQDTNNVTALNNLAFLKMYQQDITAASALIQQLSIINQPEPYVLINTAILDVMQGGLETAINKLTTLVKSYPALNPVLIMLMKNLTAQGKLTEANKILTRIRSERLKTPVYYLAAAELYNQLDKTLPATSELIEGASKFPNNKDIAIELVLSYAKANNTEKFRENLLALKQDDLENDYRIPLAKYLISEDKYHNQRFLDDALEKATLDSQKLSVLLPATRALLIDGHHQTAQVLLEKAAIGKASPRLEAIILRLRSAQPNISPSEKESILKNVTDLFNTTPHLPIFSRIDIAWAFLRLGKVQQAVDLLDRIPPSQSADLDRLRALSLAYHLLSRQEEKQATETRIRSIENQKSRQQPSIQGDNTAYRLATGNAHSLAEILNQAINEEDYTGAISIYTDILNNDKVKRLNPAATYQNRGALYLLQENYEAAQLDFAKALSLGALNDNQRELILYNYADTLLQLKRFDDSIKALEESLVIQPKKVKTLFLLSRVQIQKKDYPAAITTYQSIVQIEPSQISAYLGLGKLYTLTEEFDEAITLFNRALEIFPFNRKVHLAIAQSYILSGNSAKASEHMRIANRL